MARPLPHEGVYVRIGRSDIHGIGVIACRPIPAGTNVFAVDQAEIRWVPALLLDDPSLSDFERSLYRDFAVRRGKELGCPANFNLLTVGWFLNEPAPGEEPNVLPTADAQLVAARDIDVGEELTIRYAAFHGN